MASSIGLLDGRKNEISFFSPIVVGGTRTDSESRSSFAHTVPGTGGVVLHDRTQKEATKVAVFVGCSSLRSWGTARAAKIILRRRLAFKVALKKFDRQFTFVVARRDGDGLLLVVLLLLLSPFQL